VVEPADLVFGVRLFVGQGFRSMLSGTCS
jgi:hypothetical protein